ncbi:hypothetical protein K469DRAFT_752993 [Zopfia rhizophila CBS 207.26]|uniref:BZIP domain-containing protein n=1 Tax=Zopfia rhizophila CBS 207.26 TaxID=1314779 RepID=A0A6A6DNP6_9PEZI|nr:hypothetical protein K469DRAFT_752993 [Zopfia rhizophila CBS 207.26]
MPKRKSQEIHEQHDEPEESLPSKRAKSTKQSNISEQRARKRALDRVAQRTLREKTKKYIAHLEQTVEACRAGSDSDVVKELLGRNRDLYTQVETPRKIINDITAIVHPETLPDTLQEVVPRNRGNIPTSDPDQTRKRPVGIADRTPATSVDDEPNVEATTLDSVAGPAAERGPETAQVPSGENESNCQYPISVESSGPQFQECYPPWSGNESRAEMSPDQAMNMLSGHGDGEDLTAGAVDSRDSFNPSDSYSIDVPQIAPATPALAQNHVGLEHQEQLRGLWQLTNAIFSKIFWADSSQAREADIVQILREYDETLWKGFDLVNRLAIAYKNHYLIKYFLNSNPVNLRRMPEWQRPQPFSRTKKHPIGIYFFAWPGLRDRLLDEHPNIPMEDFAAAFQRHFRFDWPFSFEDTFYLDHQTGSYYPSPLFERYHKDLKYWTMDQAFFQKFPNVANDISAHTVAATSPEASGGSALVAISHECGEHQGINSSRVVDEPTVTFGGVDIPEHWVSQLMAGLPSGL